MNTSPSNSDDVLMQRIKDTENLLEEIKGHQNSPDSKVEDESVTREKILKALTGLLPQIEYRNGNLSTEIANKISLLVKELTNIDRLNNDEFLRNYLLRLVLIYRSTRHEVQAVVTK